MVTDSKTPPSSSSGVWIWGEEGGVQASLRSWVWGHRGGYPLWDPAAQAQALHRAEKVMMYWGQEGVPIHVLGPFPSLTPHQVCPSSWLGSKQTHASLDVLTKSDVPHPGIVVLDLMGACVKGPRSPHSGLGQSRVHVQPTLAIVHASEDASQITYPIPGTRKAHAFVQQVYTRLARAYWLGLLQSRLETLT